MAGASLGLAPNPPNNKHAHITEVASYDTTGSELKHLGKTINWCTNYQCSLTSEELQGVVDVDCVVEFTCETTGTKRVGLTLCDILLKYFTMTDGHVLIAEVHQCRVLSPVEVIITNTEEAETMIARMNVHLPAFCYHYLLDKGLRKPYIAALIQESCCVTLTVEIPTCVWDLDKMFITTKEAKETNEK